MPWSFKIFVYGDTIKEQTYFKWKGYLIMAVKEYIKKNAKRKDLTTFLLNNLEKWADEYLNNWPDRYPEDDNRNIRKKIEEDLDNFHNPVVEYEKVEKALNRELTDEEIDIVFRAFNETVMDVLERKLTK
jgi:hypothetical protein